MSKYNYSSDYSNIKVGDEVRLKDGTAFVVTYNGSYLCGILNTHDKGQTIAIFDGEEIRKTGVHYNEIERIFGRKRK